MTVDEANNFIWEFRREMLRAIRKMRDLEEPRCEAVHSVINQFVVFEQSAEMNNKYDLGNFAKLLQSFTPQQEMDNLDHYLFGTSVSKTKIDSRLLGGEVDRSLIGMIMEGGRDAVAIKKASISSSISSSSSVVVAEGPIPSE